MKIFSKCIIIILLIGLSIATFNMYSQDRQPDPVKLFVDNKCTSCHSIIVIGIMKTNDKSKAPDLSDSKERGRDFLTKYLKKEVDIDGKKHGISWRGTEGELKVMVDWLLTIRPTEKK